MVHSVYSHISFGFYPSSFDGYDYCAPFFESGGTDRSIKKSWALICGLSTPFYERWLLYFSWPPKIQNPWGFFNIRGINSVGRVIDWRSIENGTLVEI